MSDCLFCSFVNGDIPVDLVGESDLAIAFADINPQAPTHVLVVPRAHHANVGALAAADPASAVAVLDLAREVAGGDDFRLVFNTGAGAGQSVFHVHAHVLAGRPLQWPPG